MFGREEKVSPFRLTVAQYVLLGIFLFLAFGLWRLQVARSDYYLSLAEQNRVKQVPILAPRGKLLDREGRIIVDNYPSFSVLLLRDQNRNLEIDAEKIAEGLHIPPDELRARLKRMAAVPGYQPLFLKDDITPDELAFIESHRADLPELDIITVHRRLYPKNGFMAHVIGYVGQVSEEMLTQPQWELYNPGDVVGMSGVEQYYNDVLMGKNGSRQVLVNSRGKEVGTLRDVPAIPGKQLKLTIDLDLQIAAEQALEGRPGAIVAMDPRTGEILAMVSRPAFDPNAFAVRVSRDEWNRLIQDPGKPLLNKAIQAQLAPGSVFKVIMATAGLQEGIAQNLVVSCGGGKSFYGRFFKCWIAERHSTHGSVSISKAIYQSCDSYFYTLAEKLGISRIAKYATMLGERLARHGSRVWLVNTGWTGGPYGVGKRMSLSATRAMVRAALGGALDNVPTSTDPVFGLEVPTSVPDVPDSVLQPRNVWPDKAAYDTQARKLAAMFRTNFEKFAGTVDRRVADAGPRA